jgi:hypothetical protein
MAEKFMVSKTEKKAPVSAEAPATKKFMPTMNIHVKKPGSPDMLDIDRGFKETPDKGMALKNVEKTLREAMDDMKASGPNGQELARLVTANKKFQPLMDKKFMFVYDDMGKLDRVVDPDTSKDIKEFLSEGAGEEQMAGPGNPGFKCGGEIKKKGMAQGGAPEDMAEMATEAPVPEVPATAEASPAPGTPPEGNMDGPFKTYAKIPGIDEELISRGDGLFTQLQTAVEGGDEMAIQEYMDQLKSFVADIESARQDAVSKANDTSLAAAYKEMSAEAKDLLTAFENIIGDQESPEMMAGKPTQTPEAVV